MENGKDAGKIVERALLFGVLVVYGLAIFANASPFAAGADSSGYMNEARLLAEGRLSTDTPGIPELSWEQFPSILYQPLGFRVMKDPNKIAPAYPQGLPIHLALAAEICGWEVAPRVVLALAAVIGLWILYLIAEQLGLSAGWRWAGVCLLGLSPLYMRCMLELMSDVLATSWCGAAILFAIKGRDRPGWALAAGASVGMAVLVRPTNLLMLAPVLVALGLERRRHVFLILGGMPAALWTVHLNHALYGKLLTTGYGDASSLFKRRYFFPTMIHFARWLAVFLTPVTLLLFLGLPSLEAQHARARRLLLVWFSSITIFYGFYFHSSENDYYLRFLLPVFPAVILGALLVARQWTAGWWSRPRLTAAVAGLLVVSYGAYSFWWSAGKLVVKEQERGYQLVSDWTRQHLPDNAVVAAMQTSGAFLYYTRFPIVRWDHINERYPAWNEARRKLQRPLFAVTFAWEESRALRQQMPGEWVLVGKVQEINVWKQVDPPTDQLPPASSTARLE